MVVDHDRGRPPLWLKLFGAFSFLCLAGFALALVLPAGRFTSTALTVLDDPAIAFAVAALLFARARSRGGLRRVWTLFAAGTAAWLAGELVFEVRDALGAGSGTSVADVFYLLFYPPVMAGLFLLGREDRRRRNPGHVLDVVIVMGGAGLLLWALVRQTSLTAAGDLSTQTVDIAYVALGLGLLWMLIIPAVHADVRWTTSRTLLACSFIGIVAADTLWAMTPSDAYGLIASSSLALLGIAAARDPSPDPAGPDPENSRRHHLVAELAVVAVGAFAGALTVWVTISDGAPADLVLGAGALLVLVLARLVVSITFNDRLLAESDRRASTDPLTGLLNHGSFHEQLAREVARSVRSGDPLALLLIDLDHLKTVNDLGGHRAGDEVLGDVANLLRATCRETDLVCRIGGDEMAVIAPATGLEQARDLADRLTRAAHSIWSGPAHARIQVSLSLGLSVLPTLATTKARLTAQADAALYAAKQRGRDGWLTFDPRTEFEDVADSDVLRAQAQLAGRASDFRAVFTHALEPMIITDHVPVILEANDAAVQLAGVSREDLVGRNLAEFVDGPEASALPRILASIEEASRQGGTIHVTLPSGRAALIEFAASRFAPDRTLVGLRDITMRTEALAELTRSEARFRGLFDGALDAILITDDAGTILDANPAAAKLTSRSRPELLGTPVRDLGQDGDRALIDHASAELLREHTRVDTFPFVDDNGDTRLVEYSSTTDFVPGEHLSIVRDVTDRVAAAPGIGAGAAPTGA